MSRYVNKTSLLRAALALVTSLVLAGSAQALLFTGKWDPAFSADFPDLGWQGEAKFFVPDACLSLDGWVSNSDPCSMSGMRLLGAEIDFYRLSDPANAAFHETLLFDEPSSTVASMKMLLKLFFMTYSQSRLRPPLAT